MYKSFSKLFIVLFCLLIRVIVWTEQSKTAGENIKKAAYESTGFQIYECLDTAENEYYDSFTISFS